MTEFNYEKIIVKETAALPKLGAMLSRGMALAEMSRQIESLEAKYPPSSVLRYGRSSYNRPEELSITFERLENDFEHKRRVNGYEREKARAETASAKKKNVNLARLEKLRQQVAELEATLHPTV